MTAPYTLLVGDHTVHLLSKYSADSSAVVGARVKDGQAELYSLSLVAAQREREAQQLAQLTASPTAASGGDASNAAGPSTPSKAQKPAASSSPVGPAVRDLWGIFGFIALHQGPFMIAITTVTKVGRWLGIHDIYQINKVALLPVSSVPLFPLGEEDRKREAALVEKLTTLIEDSGFYFSYTFDLTNTAQRQAAQTKTTPPTPLHVVADERFYWNRFLQEEFGRLKLDAWALPCVQGFVAIIDGVAPGDGTTSASASTSQSASGSDASVATPPPSPASPDDRRPRFQYALISRRSCVRTGPRLHMRGADYEGNAATFSEQEQLLHCNGALAAFVQTRGSIPLVWHQLDRKQMKPKPVVLQTSAQRRTARRHFAMQRQLYGAVVVVTLLDQTGIEMDLAEAYETYTRLIADARLSFVAFDFHEICKGGKYENISVLLQQVKTDLAEHGFFHLAADGRTVVAQQSGVMRTNCLDCLDRTNVVQSVMAHHILRNQMEALGVLGGGEPVESMVDFEAAWKNAWADNADAMSRLYTGTGALKTAFTRTGQWTVSGALLDGMTSAKRYVNQTVYDDEKLQLQHLLLGEHLVFRANALLDECESDGVFRFRVMKQQLAAPPDPVVLEVDIMRGQFTHYALKDNTKRVRSLARLYRVVRAQRNFRRLRVIFSSNPAPKDYDFRDPESREKCVQALRSAVAVAAQKAGADASTELMPLLPLSKYERPVKVFVGCWNLANETSPSFESWVPRDQELYAIGVQNCDYPRSADFYFSSASHFCFTLHQYLGARFERVATAQFGSLLTVIFVHSDLAPFVSSTEILPLRYPEAAVKPPPVAAPAPSFFGRLLGRSPSPDPRAKAAAQPAAEEGGDKSGGAGESKGHAVCLHVHDTGLAFLHHYIATESTPRTDSVDIYSSYDHIFSVGRFSPPAGGRWAELARHPKSDENTTIMWRSSAAPRLFAVQPTSPIIPTTSAPPAQNVLSPVPSPQAERLSPTPSSEEAVSGSSSLSPSMAAPASPSNPNPTPPTTVSIAIPPVPTSPLPPLPAASSPSAGGADSPLSSSPSVDATPRRGSRAVAFLNELAASPSVLAQQPANIANSEAPSPTTPAPATPSPATHSAGGTPPSGSPASSSYSLLEQSNGSAIRRKSSRAGEFLLQMNRAEAGSIVTRDDSAPPSARASPSGRASPLPSPAPERKASLHRRAVSDGSKIFGRQQRLPPLALTCALSVLCDFYRPSPACTIMLAGPRSPSLKLASSVAPLKGDIFLLVEAPFINPIRTKLSPRSQAPNGGWAWEDIEVNPFIADTEYLRLRHLLISAYDMDVLGAPVLIGTGRLPLSAVMDGPSDQRITLFADDSASGTLTFAALARVASIGRKPSMGKIIQSP